MNPKVANTLALGIVVLGGATTQAVKAEDMKITRQIILSPTHKVAPYSITKASNGDLIIAGADSLGTYHAWATRVSKSGELIWEYLDGPAEAWTDYSQNSQQFYSAAELRNGSTLLCGIKRAAINNKKLVAFLVRIGADGKLIDQRILQPAHDGMPIGGIRCLPSQDGVAVLSWLAVLPRGIGWFMRLDADGNVLWEKFGDQFGLEAIPADNGSLFLIAFNEVRKIDAEGNVLARQALPGSSQTFLQSAGPPTRVRIAALLSALKTAVIEFDLNLKGPLHTTHIGDIGTKRGLYSNNGVATLFGSRHVGYFNQPTAGAARVYKNGDSKGFTLEPRFQSGWFYDAVPTDSSGREFATVSSLNAGGMGALAWISFK